MKDRKVNTDFKDLRHLNWTKVRRSSGTAGSFLKASETTKGVRWYYKLSDYDAYRGIIGHECINEIIADRLLTLLEIPHLSYQLLHAKIIIDEQEYITWLCRSADFKHMANADHRFSDPEPGPPRSQHGGSPQSFTEDNKACASVRSRVITLFFRA